MAARRAAKETCGPAALTCLVEGFGIPVTNLRTAYDEDGQNELVITTDGRYGYWRDETYADSETQVIADLSKSGPTIR